MAGRERNSVPNHPSTRLSVQHFGQDDIKEITIARHHCPFVGWLLDSQHKRSLMRKAFPCHGYNDVIMGAIASQITSLAIVYSTVYSDWDQRKHQIFASLAFVQGIHRWPVTSPHKWPVTRKMFPFDDVIMKPQDSWLDSNRLDIWQAPREQFCRDACHISERYDQYNTQSRGFETSRDLAVRRPPAYHDDVIKWKHFPRYWPFVRGIHRSPVNSPHKGQWRRA